MTQRSVEGYPAAVIAGVVAASLLGVCGAFASWRFETAYNRDNRDPYMVGAQTARFAGFIEAVPPAAGLGYLTDVEQGSVVESAMLLEAQYALAPRLVARGTEHDLVLGNFTRPADFAALGNSKGLRLERDFGNGVVLYRRGAGSVR